MLSLLSRLFAPRPPLLVISFPKSGRTWLRVMLDDLNVAAAYTHDGTDHKERLSISSLNPRKTRYRGDKVLFLVRDPRDTVVSGYFQVKKRHHIDIESMSECIRSDEHGIEKIALFNLQWFDAAKKIKTFALVQYEDMQKDAAGVLHEIGAFVGRRFADDEVERIVSARRFDKMQTSEASGELATRYGGKLLPRDVDDPESFKVRRGKIGGYVDYLSESDIAHCDQVLERLDYHRRLEEAMIRHGIGRP